MVRRKIGDSTLTYSPLASTVPSSGIFTVCSALSSKTTTTGCSSSLIVGFSSTDAALVAKTSGISLTGSFASSLEDSTGLTSCGSSFTGTAIGVGLLSCGQTSLAASSKLTVGTSTFCSAFGCSSLTGAATT